jgi:hypothetical protein
MPALTRLPLFRPVDYSRHLLVGVSQKLRKTFFYFLIELFRSLKANVSMLYELNVGHVCTITLEPSTRLNHKYNRKVDISQQAKKIYFRLVWFNLEGRKPSAAYII